MLIFYQVFTENFPLLIVIDSGGSSMHGPINVANVPPHVTISLDKMIVMEF